MKKVFSICLIAVMVLSASVMAFAAPDGFTNSPSGNAAPEVVDFKADDKDCDGELLVTAYVDKDTLPQEYVDLMALAYKEITEANKLTDLEVKFAALVSEEKLDASKLAVSDLFDLSVENCDHHEGHHGFSIKLGADTLKNFVALLHMKSNGEWELIENATVSEDGETLSFSVDSCSPFAIVVNTGSSEPQPQPQSNAALWIALGAAGLLIIIIILIKRRKKDEDEKKA